MSTSIINWTPVTGCRICGGALEWILDYGDMPLAGAFFTQDHPLSRTKIPLTLMWCGHCWLLQTGQSVSRDQIFTAYSYQSSVAPPLVMHFEELAQKIRGVLKGQGKDPDGSLVIDIGCNDGVLVRPLSLMGVLAVGIDPSDVSLKASLEDKWPLINAYAEPKIVHQVTNTYGHADIVVASNVFAHTDDLHSLVTTVRDLLKPDGVFICEVQYAGALLKDCQFDTVYHEHTVYYSLKALQTLLTQHGLKIWSYEYIDTHSGSVRIYASPIAAPFELAGANHEGLTFLEDLANFKRRAPRAKEIITDVIHSLARHTTIWAYGAAGRCTTLLNWCELNYRIIPYVVDASPRRIGRVVPGVEIPIVGPKAISIPNEGIQYRPEALFVTAWNYFDDIRGQHPDFEGWWIRPLPRVEIM